jgi:hypothetical protein
LSGTLVVAGSALAQVNAPVAPQALAERLAVAESVIAREESASERPFDPSFRAKTLERLAALPMDALLQAQTQENAGLGLNVLGDSQADLVYTPVTPCRIIDTRLAGGTLTPGLPRSFTVTGDTTFQGGADCGIPFGPATSAMINFVAVSPAGKGNMQVTPFGQAMPLASFINFSTNDITIQANNSAVDLVADVQGYFRRVSTGGVGTSLLADSAVTTVKMAAGSVTAPKIANGVVVRSLNSQTDAVTLAGANGLGVSQGSGTVTVTSNATSANTPSTIVSRDGSGNFSAGTITAAGNLALPNTTSASVGVLTIAGTRFLHNFGNWNTFVGRSAGNLSMEGGFNAGFGYAALLGNTTAYNNSAFGGYALTANTTANNNSAFGHRALEANTTGAANSGFGAWTLSTNTDGIANSAFGISALEQLSSGSNNIAIGPSAGYNLTSGDWNIYIGNTGGTSESNTIRVGGGNHTATYVAGIYWATATARTVYVDSDGKLGTLTSSRRYKEQIADMDTESDVLLKLRPVSFYYRPELDETHLRQYGLVAEEVAEVAPTLSSTTRTAHRRPCAITSSTPCC